jgi:hypothetical protein
MSSSCRFVAHVERWTATTKQTKKVSSFANPIPTLAEAESASAFEGSNPTEQQ